jgi:hypothetical protein
MAPDPTPKIDVKRLVSLSARVGETKSWLVVGTARNVDVVQVQFVEPWLIDPVIAYCRSQHDALPAEWQPIDVAADEKVWVARFDIELFGRYALLAHLLTHLEASRDAEAVIQVTSVGTDQPVQAPSRPFTRNDVGWDPYEFDVGVLLVHGIGPHVRGQTLVNFSDPLIKFIHGWFRGFNDWSASNYAGESGKLREAVETGPLANDPGHWGLREELERFTSQVRTDGKAGEATATGAPLFGSAQVSKVVLAQSPNEPDTPANAVIRLAVIDDAAAPREASVLLSEAWWAPCHGPADAPAALGLGVSRPPLDGQLAYNPSAAARSASPGSGKIITFAIHCRLRGVARPNLGFVCFRPSVVAAVPGDAGSAVRSRRHCCPAHSEAEGLAYAGP